MKKIDLIHSLADLDRKGVYVLARRDIEKMFPDEKDKAMEKSLQRMVADRLLVRAARGVYVNPAASSRNSRVVEDVAKVLRPGAFSYVSLESLLSEYGVISQIPVSRITVMTTGAKGTYKTPYGTIEFTHTKRRPAEIIQRTVYVKGRPLRIATKQAAVADLMRVGRNTGMLDQDELDNLEDE
ncbi:type IV toxin-antitoxin system AbiEi family antitoxin [Lacisediminimonas sp.]|uniref:type IV toxin-antitoxin system AbiEi family antitoxin n=1 Tax=Lacisediminimonas sp. TaxID=3060582 RepID=UPI0027227C4E|nr:hypothetical protein [Lacisediminimonas sp.]MDO8298941.1 hypothetical protein [Lacisediminimonas sp.]